MIIRTFRVISIATTNAFFGLVRGLRNDKSFRVECILSFFLIPYAIYLPVGPLWTVLMCSSVILVLAAELFNSCIEQTVDYISKEYSVIARRIKDMSSGAVLLTVLVFFIVWGGAFWSLKVS